MRYSFLLIVFAFLAFAPAKRPQSVTFSKNELLGKFDPSTHPDFEKIAEEFSQGGPMYMRKEAYKAFKSMYFDAKKCGIRLTVLSATRNFERQKSIWERKWKLPENKALNETERAKTILKYSSMPGTSRHHWGTDIDLNSLNNDYFESSEGKAVYNWLMEHAAEYGFAQPYTSKSQGRTGYEEEKWHWSYRPLSDACLTAYNNSVTNEDISGFSGSEQAVVLDVVRNFVNGIY